MADFYGTMQKVQDNVSITENGMSGYKTTYHPLLDMNFKVTSYRNLTNKDICNDIDKILAEKDDAKYLLKFLFMVRDVREGLGERRLFRVALQHLISRANFTNKDEIISDLVKNQIVEFGRYDDLYAIFMGTKYQDTMIETVLNQLKQDYANMEKNKPISLLAKWMPSENTSSAETRKMAKVFIKAFGTSAKDYRQALSKLRAYLKITETYTSANEWGKIDYNQVPSKANLKYKDAFLKHDEERRRDYLAALRVGVDKDGKEVKINSTVNFPHEIVTKYRDGNYDEALEQLWKNLKQKDGLNNTIVVRDGSGSMTSLIGNGRTCALDVSTALAIYCSERLNGTFKDKFITFSSNAKLVDLSDKTNLRDKLSRCYQETECSNTNIENVFNLILNTVIEGNIKPEDMPEQVLIISDMEFDPAASRGSGYFTYGGMNADTNVFKKAAKNYNDAGYKLPKLVFWNVCSRTNTIPMKQNENGVVLVSGFSVNTLNMVLNGQTSPWLALLDEVDSKIYKDIAYLENISLTNNNTSKVKSSKKPSFLK